MNKYKAILVAFFAVSPYSLHRLILVCGCLAIAGLKAADETATDKTVDRQAAEAKFLEIRTQAVMQIDGDFFREEKFTREQVQLFTTTRLAAEDKMRRILHQTHGAVFLPSMLAFQMDTSLAEAFSQQIARRYRTWANSRLGWEIIWDNPILKAREWLTFEEQDKLARAWGPICAASMDVTFDPKFQRASLGEKQALAERLTGDYFKSAAGILDSDKLVELKKRLNEMRVAGLKEMDAGTE